jgi:hypothetical protein
MSLEVQNVLSRSDLYEREDKNLHDFCLPVSRACPYDVLVPTLKDPAATAEDFRTVKR